MTDHHPLWWLMKSNKCIGKIDICVLLLYDDGFEVVNHTNIANLDANGLSRNPSPSDKYLFKGRWHVN